MDRTRLSKQKSKLVPCGHKSSACQVACRAAQDGVHLLCGRAAVPHAQFVSVRFGLECKQAMTALVTGRQRSASLHKLHHPLPKVHSSRGNGQSVLLLFQNNCHVLDLSERRFHDLELPCWGLAADVVFCHVPSPAAMPSASKMITLKSFQELPAPHWSSYAWVTMTSNQDALRGKKEVCWRKGAQLLQ